MWLISCLEAWQGPEFLGEPWFRLQVLGVVFAQLVCTF